MVFTNHLNFTVLSFNFFSSCKHLLWPSLEFSRVLVNHLVPFFKPSCTGLDWDGVGFPHSSSYDAIFWISDQNSIDNTLFWQLLNSAYSVKAFSLSHTVLQWSRLGKVREWEGTQLGQLTPTEQGDIPCHMTTCSAIKTDRRIRKGVMVVFMAFVFPSKHQA